MMTLLLMMIFLRSGYDYIGLTLEPRDAIVMRMGERRVSGWVSLSRFDSLGVYDRE